MNHHANLEALKGKWVLLDFLGLNCSQCLTEGIPELVAFYERNKAHKRRFEIVGLYLESTGTVDSIAVMQKELEPFEKYVWNGKRIPFSVVVDNMFTNWEPFGLSEMGDFVLINPAGQVARGDLTRLQEILDGDESDVP